MPSFLSSFRALCLFTLIASAAVLAGCSRPTGTVSGKVTFKGEPLKGGSVAFYSTEGYGSRSGRIEKDGSYVVGDLPTGNYKIVIDNLSLKPASATNKAGGYSGSGGKSGKMSGNPKQSGNVSKDKEEGKPLPPEIQEKMSENFHASDPKMMSDLRTGKLYVEIPATYANQDTTPETYTVVSGSQTHDIEIR